MLRNSRADASKAPSFFFAQLLQIPATLTMVALPGLVTTSANAPIASPPRPNCILQKRHAAGSRPDEHPMVNFVTAAIAAKDTNAPGRTSSTARAMPERTTGGEYDCAAASGV